MKAKINKGRRPGPKGGSDLEKDLQLIHSDPRFSHVTSDPKYRHIRKEEHKVKLDSRFRSILTDEKFYEKSTMDPRGRKGNYSTKEDLLRFYHLSSDEDSEEEEEDGKQKTEEEEKDEDEEKEDEEEEGDSEEESSKNKDEGISVDQDGSSHETKERQKRKTTKKENKKPGEGEEMKKIKEEHKKNMSKEVTAGRSDEDAAARDTEERSEVTPEVTERLQDLTRDYARGGGDLFSSDSSDDDSSTTDEEAEDGAEFEWAELDRNAVWDNEAEVEETSRIAVCNLDWDRIKAADLMVLFSSFCPLGGSVRSVAIYPSEYGKKRMAEEDCSGPQELTLGTRKGRKDEEDGSESMNLVDLDKLEKGKLDGSRGATRLDFEALRRYQRNRLSYYYAVMECDTVETARSLYRECDRQPFEGAGILLDLRYIPSDMTFDETPHDLCQTVPRFYKAKTFVTTALQYSRPALTWDETDPERSKALSTAMTQALKGDSLDEEQLKEFLASSSGEEEEEEDEEREDDSTSDEEGNEEVRAVRIAKFRALIREIDEKAKKREREIDMEDTLEDSREEKEEEEEENNATTNKQEIGDTQLNPFEKYLEKRRVKRKEKKKKQKEKKALGDADENGESDRTVSDDEVPGGTEDLYSDPFFAGELKKGKMDRKKGKKKQQRQDKNEDDSGGKDNFELLLMEEDQEDKRHFNMREIIKNREAETKKKRRKSKLKMMMEKQKEQRSKQDDFKVNTSDPRFSELLTSGDYNVDPSHPQFRRTGAMDRLIEEMQRKRMAESGEAVPMAKRPHLGEESKHLEVTSLVQKVKRKTGKGKVTMKRNAT